MSDNTSFTSWLDGNASEWEHEIRKLWEQGKKKRIELEESVKAEAAIAASRSSLEQELKLTREKIEQQAEAESWSDERLESALNGNDEWADAKRAELAEAEEEAESNSEEYLDDRWNEYQDEHEDDFKELIEELWPLWRARMLER